MHRATSQPRLLSFLLVVSLVAVCSIGANAENGGIMDRKFGKLQRSAKFPLFSKLRDVVSSRSRKSSKDDASDASKETTTKEEPLVIVPSSESKRVEIEIVDVEPKATGIRVVPVRASPVEPKITGPLVETSDCVDIAPDSVYTCEEQRDFGKCDAEFMVLGNYCARTCGRPPCRPVAEDFICDDVPPSPEYTCSEQREFGKCDAEFMVMGNYCARSCGRPPCPPIDESCTTISEGVEGSALLAFLDLALEVTDLKRVFDDPTLRVTVFAPTNVAFEDLLSDLEIDAEQLLEYPDIVEEILGAHVLVDPFLSTELEDGAVYETLSETSDLEISIGDGVFVVPEYGLPAEVVSTDLDACGSVVHVIDTVLIPDRSILLALDLPDNIIAKYEAMAMRAKGLL